MRYLIMALLVSVMALAGCKDKKDKEDEPKTSVAPEASMSEAVESYL